MDLGLRGARALITGGSRGIGFAIADALAAEGASVGLVARGADGLAAAAGRLARHGVPVTTAAADVTDTAALDRAVEDVAAALGGLDRLVANAGGTVGGNIISSGPGDFTATFALNAGHAVELIRTALPHLRSAGGGAVVIISSITGMRPAPRTSYSVAKAAEIQLAATAAAELAADNVRVNAVSPGSILFPGGSWERFSQENPADFAAFLGTQFPFGRLGRLEEVADVVAFLLSRAGVVDHRRQHRRRRRPGLPERPALPAGRGFSRQRAWNRPRNRRRRERGAGRGPAVGDQPEEGSQPGGGDGQARRRRPARSPPRAHRRPLEI